MLLLLLSAVLRPSKQIFCHSLSSSKPPLLQRRNLSLTMTHTTLRNSIITVTPQNESDQSASVIICHGLGDSAEGFVDVAEHLSGALPYVKFILPTAPTQRVSFVELRLRWNGMQPFSHVNLPPTLFISLNLYIL